MAGRPKGKKAKVTRQKVKFDPFGFDKVMKEFMARPKEERKLDKKEVKPRDMDDAIIKIQKQFLIDKKKLKKKTGGYTVTNRYSDIMLPGKKRTTRIT